MMTEVTPDRKCDRCEHPYKVHAGPDRGSRCMIADGKVWKGTRLPPRALRCWCDGYVPRPG